MTLSKSFSVTCYYSPSWSPKELSHINRITFLTHLWCPHAFQYWLQLLLHYTTAMTTPLYLPWGLHYPSMLTPLPSPLWPHYHIYVNFTNTPLMPPLTHPRRIYSTIPHLWLYPWWVMTPLTHPWRLYKVYITPIMTPPPHSWRLCNHTPMVSPPLKPPHPWCLD